MQVTIVDYNSGNLKSVYSALNKASNECKKKIKIRISNNPKIILGSDKIILPGQGSYHHCISSILSIKDLWEVLNFFVLNLKKPIFGICVGMQIFSNFGFEKQKTKGFGWIPGDVKKIKTLKNLKIPHIGWNEVNILKKNTFLLKKIKNLSHFYFVHSYNFEVKDKRFILAKTKYGTNITAAVQRENIIGTQFHPEKSQIGGVRILENFLKI